MRMEVRFVNDGDTSIVHPQMFIDHSVRELPASFLHVGMEAAMSDYLGKIEFVVKHCLGGKESYSPKERDEILNTITIDQMMIILESFKEKEVING